MWTKLALLGALALRAAAHSQAPFSSARAHAHTAHASTPKFDAAALGNAFTKFAASPVNLSAARVFVRTDMGALSADAYTALTHPAYPRHGLRVKKSRFCDGGVDAYTGYVDVEARHIFFYFFKSRGDWKNDNVIFVRALACPR
jgi:uncharacterized phage-associated protein